MATRYLGAQGEVYVEQWQAATNGDDWVYVMPPERWLSAGHTSTFEALGG